MGGGIRNNGVLRSDVFNMLRIIRLLDQVEDATERDIERVVMWLERHHPKHKFIPSAGRFAGFSFVSPTGEIVMALQTVDLNTPLTAPLIFTDASGNIGPGPIGIVSASDPSVTVALSSDGQACNVTMTATLPTPVTLTWHDPAGNVPDFTVDITDAPVAIVAQTGAFGPFTPGSTA